MRAGRRGDNVEAEIRVSGGPGADVDEVAELTALLEWLRGEPGLAGAIRAARTPPRPDELGGAVEALVVALGPGGAAGILAGSLFGWLRTRRPSVKVTVTKGSGSVTVEASEVRDGDVLTVLREALRTGDGL
jgi:hypothetical protein